MLQNFRLLVTCICMCLLSQLVASKSNAGGYFCKGCAVVMEHTFLQVIEKMQFMEANTPAGEEKEVRVDFEEEIVKPLCTSALFLDYTREIKDACKQIVDKNSRVVANAFSKPKSDYSFLYDKIQMVCGEDRMNLCDMDEVQVDLTSKCDMCLTIVQDIKNVLTRKKAADVYMTRKHIWSVLEDECQHIVFRFQGKVGRRLQSMCENLMDDHDEEMAEAFLEGNNLGKNICGKNGANFCRKRKGQWSGKDSPFMQVPGSARERNDL